MERLSNRRQPPAEQRFDDLPRRRKLVVGNWKMHGMFSALAELDRIAAAAATAANVEVAICPPFTLIGAMSQRANGLRVGGQDCHFEDKGARTGRVAACQLRDAGAELVILGHSECRNDLGDTSDLVQLKARTALRAGLRPIICVGESETDREIGLTTSVVEEQLIQSVPAEARAESIVVAYEPIWAIGTGRIPTVEEVRDVHAVIRGRLTTIFGGDGGRVQILYGGSVVPANAAKLLAIQDVDGLLVGGASLAVDSFALIIRAASFQ